MGIWNVFRLFRSDGTEQAHLRSAPGLPPEDTARKSDTVAAPGVDQVIQEVERSVDGLQNSLDKLRGAIPDLIALETRCDRLRLIRSLAEDGIFDSLQRLAKALEEADAATLPEPLSSLSHSARMALDRICRTFQVEAVYQPGETVVIAEEQVKDFHWSVDHAGKLFFPVQVEVLRCGWKVAEGVFVLPRVRVRVSAGESIAGS